MNGMKAKKLRRERAIRFTDEGLPRDAKDWTVKDWIDLYRALEAVKAKIRARHSRKRT